MGRELRRGDVLPGRRDAMPRECATNLYYVRTVPVVRLGPRLTLLHREKIRQVWDAPFFALGVGGFRLVRPARGVGDGGWDQ